MVAKSYQNFPQIGEPFERNGRNYIKVQMPSGLIKEVRWYYDPVSLDSLHIARFGSLDRNSIWYAPQISLEEGIAANLKSTGARYRSQLGWYWFSKPNEIQVREHTWNEELALLKDSAEFAHLLNK